MRLDEFIVKRELSESREKAKHLIKEGKVSVDGVIVKKPSKKIDGKNKIEILEEFKYVGRGGYKLEKAVDRFNISLKGKIIADLGCSTGGFSDYVLKKGAKRVYAVDIGDDLHKNLRNNKKLIYMPNTDVRELKTLKEKIDLCLIDITFFPLEDILINIKELLKSRGEVLALIKPPFETGQKIKKVYGYEECRKIAENVSKWANSNGYLVLGLMESPIRGKSSNQLEFFIYLINSEN